MNTLRIGAYCAPRNYCGRILFKKYGAKLQEFVSEATMKYAAFDGVGGPAIPYVAAWEDDRSNMWYEFAGDGLLRLLECSPENAAERIRESILERRVYKSFDLEAGVRRESLYLQDLEDRRAELRKESVHDGRVEAVYKLILKNGGIVWMKDLANITVWPADGVNLALGSLTVVSREMESEQRIENLLRELGSALEKVRTLKGLLPICANCKKIRDDQGYWLQVEDYIRRHSKAEFSHGLCPDCARFLYPEIFRDEEKQTKALSPISISVPDCLAFLKKR